MDVISPEAVSCPNDIIASSLNSVSSTISMQLPSTGEHKHRTIITASNGLEGDIYGI